MKYLSTHPYHVVSDQLQVLVDLLSQTWIQDKTILKCALL